MYNFIVIGGGIAGASAGARLASLGSVLLLEGESACGYHTSGRSAALYEATYGKPSTIALNEASRDYHEAAGVLSPRGLMLIEKAGDTGFDTDCAQMKMHDVSIAEAQAMIPVLDAATITRAAYHADAWDIDTDKLLQRFLAELRANGDVITGARVTSITRQASGWTIMAGEDVFEGTVLVNASGAWADQIAVLAGIAPIGLTPLRRSMARVPAPGGHDVSGWPMLFGPGEAWYAKPDAGALLISPADETLVEPHDAWPEDLDLATGIDHFMQYTTAPVERLLSSWAGLRTFAPDRNLVLGPDPSEPSFVWCAGQGGYGMQTSPGASQFLADTLAGRATGMSAEVAALLSPARFT